MKKFPSSLSQGSIIITCLVFALAIVIFIVGFISYRKTDNDPFMLFFCCLVPAVLLIVMIAMYCMMPVSVTLGDTALTIDQKVKSVTVSYADIRSVRIVPRDEMKSTIRTFGNGGLFGFTGMFYNKKLGSMHWYCSQHKNYIMIVKNDNKQLVISPDDPQAFIQGLEQVKPAVLSVN